jgi:hypothetical protein
MDVLMRQPRMVDQDRLGRHASTEFAQNKLYGTRVPRMTGLPAIISGLVSMRSWGMQAAILHSRQKA